MPRMSDTTDILGYMNESEAQHDHITARSLGEILDEPELPRLRWPVRNLEERTPIEPLKRALIHERDGNICRHCGDMHQRGRLVLDHIIPRSAFPPDQLHIADRSDNLISSCWPCNEHKSNYEDDHRKRPGVTAMCWGCQNPELNREDMEPEELELVPELRVIAFCGRCGFTTVPDLSWIL